MADYMIKRVAIAIAMANGDEGGTTWPEFVGDAHAAVEAMRDPSDRMLKAGLRAANPSPQECWQAMIEVALKESHEG
jgi:hypothetical protein